MQGKSFIGKEFPVMTPLSAPRKILWAVDPFVRDSFLIRRTAKAVSILAAQWDAVIHPVYVFGQASASFKDHPFVVRDLQLDGENRMDRLLGGLDFPEREPLFILEASGSELRAIVDDLLEFSKKRRAGVIALGTHARRGLERLLYGSFAETLIHRADVPLYVINPQGAIAKRLNHVLFPTDFSPESKVAFKRVVEFARQLKANLTIFHVLKLDDVIWGEPGIGIYPTPADLLPQEIKQRTRQADQWAQLARASGVIASYEIERMVTGTVSDAVVEIAKRRATLVAMAAHSGPLASALLGSVTRQVIRAAPCPVWIVHTEQRAKSRYLKSA
jgi:nucleotide-binding universal stress UspA family protein